MARFPKGTHEYTDEFGVLHYTNDLKLMWLIACLVAPEEMKNCKMPNKRQRQEIVNLCDHHGLPRQAPRWTPEKLVPYIGAYIGKIRRERLEKEKSLQEDVDNHRKMVGYDPAF
jgi:hypothetical protein